MCEVMERYEQKAAKKSVDMFEDALIMLNDGKTPEEIVLMDIPKEIVDRAVKFRLRIKKQ